MALVRSDPFRDVDRLFQQLWSGQKDGMRSMAMPMDAQREGDRFVIRLDLPGVNPGSLDVTVEEDVLTIKAERTAPRAAEGTETMISERPYGTFSRQVFLGTNLDTENIHADYESGVLTVSIPVAERAKARHIEVSARSEKQELGA